MPPRDVLFGPDQLTVPWYLSKGDDDPGLLEWKRDHPDGFVAGTWTPGPVSGPNETRQRQLEATQAAVGRGRDLAPLDPATISLADSMAVTAGVEQEGAVGRDRSPNVFSTEANSARDLKIIQDRIDPVAHTDPAGGVPLVLNDGSPVLDRAGKPMLVPPNVDVNRNVRIGRQLSSESNFARIFDMASLLRPGGTMDYQRTFGSGSSNPLFNDINRSYIAFGNFNFGAVAAAAGLSLDNAEIAAGLANVMGGDRSGPHGTNPTTLPYIIEGFRAYQDGLIGPR